MSFYETNGPAANPGRLKRVLDTIENGKLFYPVQLAILLFSLTAILFAGINLSGTEVVNDAPQVRHYSIKRVSTIPAEQKAEISKADTRDDRLTPDDIRRRYVNYLIGIIERNKTYPEKEQKLGREGTVGIRLYIEKSGGVRKAVVTRQSRYANLTGAAVDSIRRSIPLPPFPKGLPDDEIILNLNIEYYLR